MTVTIKYFASLRERMGRAEDRLDPPAGATIAQVWAAASGDQPMPENLLAAVNQTYVGRSHQVKDGDEVAFFPPVTGG